MHAILAARFTPDPEKPRPCATDVAIVPILPSRKSWQKLGLPGPLQVHSVVLVLVGLEVQSLRSGIELEGWQTHRLLAWLISHLPTNTL